MIIFRYILTDAWGGASTGIEIDDGTISYLTFALDEDRQVHIEADNLWDFKKYFHNYKRKDAAYALEVIALFEQISAILRKARVSKKYLVL